MLGFGKISGLQFCYILKVESLGFNLCQPEIGFMVIEYFQLDIHTQKCEERNVLFLLRIFGDYQTEVRVMLLDAGKS